MPNKGYIQLGDNYNVIHFDNDKTFNYRDMIVKMKKLNDGDYYFECTKKNGFVSCGQCSQFSVVQIDINGNIMFI